MHSCLYEGQVKHRRFAPKVHTFNTRLFYTYLDLDELGRVFSRRWLWSTHYPSLAWFRRSDYLGDVNVPLKTAVCDRVEHETGQRPGGPIRLLTHLRYFGYVFNPVSFYYCFDPTDSFVDTIVAEITNTPWGERHTYVLPREKNISSSNDLHFRFGKDFHISPYMPMDIRYDWSFITPGQNLHVHMENIQNEHKIFDATLNLHRKPLNAMTCARVLTRYPLMTFKVIIIIYWQALLLFLKRTPFYTHPAKHKLKTHGGAESAKPL